MLGRSFRVVRINPANIDLLFAQAWERLYLGVNRTDTVGYKLTLKPVTSRVLLMLRAFFQPAVFLLSHTCLGQLSSLQSHVRCVRWAKVNSKFITITITWARLSPLSLSAVFQCSYRMFLQWDSKNLWTLNQNCKDQILFLYNLEKLRKKQRSVLAFYRF